MNGMMCSMSCAIASGASTTCIGVLGSQCQIVWNRLAHWCVKCDDHAHSNFELVFDRAHCCRVFAFLKRMCVMGLSLRQVPARKDAVYSFQVSGLVISACTLGHALTTMLPPATFLFLNGQLTVSPCRCRPNNCFLGGARCGQRERTGGESGRSHRLYFAPRLLVVPSMLHRPSTMVPCQRARTALSMPPDWPVILMRLLVTRLLTQVALARLLIMRPLTRL